MKRSSRAAIALGSNLAGALDSPSAHILLAFSELDELPGTRLISTSQLYRSRAIGRRHQADYCNAVAIVETQLSAAQLLVACRLIEHHHGRRPGLRWSARPLDLDLLLYAEQRSFTEHLRLPHPRLHERRFVLQPLAEVAADWRVPGQGRVDDLLAACSGAELQEWAE